MNNPSPNNQRNMRRAVALLAIVLALLLCFRLCKRKTTEDPIPPPTHQETTPTKAAPQHASGRTHPKGSGLRTRKDAGRKGIMGCANTDPTTPKKGEKYATAEDEGVTDAPRTRTEPTERPVEQQPRQQPDQPAEPKVAQQGEPAAEENTPAEKTRQPKSAREPRKRITVRYKGHSQSRIGIRAGAGYAVINNLGAMVEDGNIRPRYTLEERGATVPTIGVFALLRRNRLAMELATDYTWLASTLKEHKLAGNVNEETNFGYHVLMPQVAVRLYLLGDLYMGVGVGLALPLNPGGIDFTSDRPAMFASADELTQAHLRETLRARVQAMPLIKVGYSSFKNGIEAYLQYAYGLTDLIQTKDNPYGYATARNNSHLFVLTVGYTIPLNKNKQP